jgi:RNA polymerase sigma factor (sigma-70 family)
METDDRNLLREFASRRSEDAFAMLVSRHVNLVYSVALRHVRSHQLAEEVTQSVFTDLARNAGKLKADTILTAWLYRVTYRTAVDVVRSESRRQVREQKAMEAAAMNSASSDWSLVEPLLDEEMQALDDADRSAILLRYFESKSLREVGHVLGISEDAAQNRVSRAVDRLRESFSKRGVAVGAGGLVVAISANAVQAAPVGLAATVSSAAVLAGATVATTATITKAIAMTTLQKTVITVSIAAAVGGGIYEARHASALRTQVHTLQQQQTSLTGQIQQLAGERDDAVQQFAALRDENERLRRDTADMPRLRDEVAGLHNDSQELAQLKEADAKAGDDPTWAEEKAWLARVSQLKQRLEKTPEARIPELQFVTEQDWLDAARGKLETDKDYRGALASLRNAGENKFVQMAQPALRDYVKTNNGQFPTDLAQLQPYFESPVDDAILQRWEIVPQENYPWGKFGEDWVIVLKAPIDQEYDGRHAFGQWGNGVSGFWPQKPE